MNIEVKRAIVAEAVRQGICPGGFIEGAFPGSFRCEICPFGNSPDCHSLFFDKFCREKVCWFITRFPEFMKEKVNSGNGNGKKL